MNPNPTIIGLYSPSPGHGKTTVAMFMKNTGYEVISFAKPLRSMIYSLLMDHGLSVNDAWEAIHDRKDEIIPYIGVSGRYLLRTLGTEWGRDQVRDDLWLLSWSARAKGFPLVVSDDVRFANEANLIRESGGELWLVTNERVGLELAASSHRSDGGLDELHFDRHICNDSTYGNLNLQVEAAMAEVSNSKSLVFSC